MFMKTPKINVYTSPPDGIARQTFRNVVSAAHMAFQLHNSSHKNRDSDGRKTLPDVKEIRKFCQHSEQTVSRVIATDEFRQAMWEKGISWTVRDGLTPEQIYCIGIMTNPSDKRDMAGKLKAAGVSFPVYRAWLRTPAFRSAVHQIGEQMLDDHIADVNTALMNKAVGGDIRAIELYHQLTGRFDPGKQQRQDLQTLIQVLLEIIFRNVTDVKILNSITEDFDKAMAGEQVTPSLGIGHQVIEDAEIVEDGHNGNSTDSPIGAPDSSDTDEAAVDFDDSIPEGFFDFFDDKEGKLNGNNTAL